jgi:rsbT co-antagonist protein RsbR
MTTMSKVAEYIEGNTEVLAQRIVEGVLTSLELRIPDEERNNAFIMYKEFLGFLGKSLANGVSGVPDDIIVWSKRNAEQQLNSGGRISEIVIRYQPTRRIFNELLTELSIKFGLAISDNALLIRMVDEILDISLSETVSTYECLSETYRRKAQQEMAELSAPVVLVKEGVAVLPLIGIIDSYRAAYVMEEVVPHIAGLQLEYLITDYSGIKNIDSEIAAHLYQLGEVLQLLGIKVIVTGLRPQLAQTVVETRIDLSAIKVFANLKQALDYLH